MPRPAIPILEGMFQPHAWLPCSPPTGWVACRLTRAAGTELVRPRTRNVGTLPSDPVRLGARMASDPAVDVGAPDGGLDERAPRLRGSPGTAAVFRTKVTLLAVDDHAAMLEGLLGQSLAARQQAGSTGVFQQPVPARDRAGDFGGLKLGDEVAMSSLGDRIQDPLPEQVCDAVE